MAQIKNFSGDPEAPKTEQAPEHGVPRGVADHESHGGYGGTERLQSESAPLHPDAGKEQAKDI